MEISITNLVENYFNNFFKNDLKNLGTEMHQYFENYLKTNKEPVLYCPDKKKIFLYFKNFLNFFLINDTKILYIEKKIKHKHNNKNIIGVIDTVFYNKKKNIYYIIDWKISYDISYKKKSELTYIMNLYAYILQKKIKKKIYVKMYLVLLHFQHENFIVLPIEKIKDNSIEYLFN